MDQTSTRCLVHESQRGHTRTCEEAVARIAQQDAGASLGQQMRLALLQKSSTPPLPQNEGTTNRHGGHVTLGSKVRVITGQNSNRTIVFLSLLPFFITRTPRSVGRQR